MAEEEENRSDDFRLSDQHNSSNMEDRREAVFLFVAAQESEDGTERRLVRCSGVSEVG